VVVAVAVVVTTKGCRPLSLAAHFGAVEVGEPICFATATAYLTRSFGLESYELGIFLVP
jgi:hypothetical protein